MDYLAVGIAAISIISVTIYTTTDYITNFLTSPVTLTLQNLSNLTQISYHTVVQVFKDQDIQTNTTTPGTTLLPSSTDNPASQNGTLSEIAILETILRTENIDPSHPSFTKMLPHLTKIVHGLVYETTACANFEQLRKTSFDTNNALHTNLLESLWDLLCPNQTREKYTANNDDNDNDNNRKSKSWSLIGFQGVDPITDLRGMGMFGLFQLIYFALTDTKQCRNALQISRAPVSGPEVKFFPFACAGIQISNLILSLARERLLGYVVLEGEEHVDGASSASNVSISVVTAKKRLQQLLKEIGSCSTFDSICLLGDIYSEIFIMLAEAWQKADPPDVMSYPKIFQSVEKEVREALTGNGKRFRIRWR